MTHDQRDEMIAAAQESLRTLYASGRIHDGLALEAQLNAAGYIVSGFHTQVCVEWKEVFRPNMETPDGGGEAVIFAGVGPDARGYRVAETDGGLWEVAHGQRMVGAVLRHDNGCYYPLDGWYGCHAGFMLGSAGYRSLELALAALEAWDWSGRPAEALAGRMFTLASVI